MAVRRAVLALLVALSFTAEAADSAVGTWKLNLAKSKFSPGPAPKSKIRVYELGPNVLKVVVTTVDAEGRTRVSEVRESFDRKQYGFQGNGPFQQVSPESVDDNTVNAELTIKPGVTVNSMRVLSKDGKKLTITIRGKDEHGRPIRDVEVYDRQ